MAELTPFRALRYRGEPPDDLSALIAPPYDVISPAQQAALYDRSPYNVIRLEYGREPGAERYRRAAADLAAWRAPGGPLLTETTPALYRYVQRFEHGGRTFERTAVIGRVRLESFESGVIRPHEYTMSRPKEDRLALLRATRTNISPVYSLVDDGDGAFLSALSSAPAASSATGTDIAGQWHRIEPIVDPEAIAAIVATLRQRNLYIADGHHRYETALAYQAERPDDPAAAYVLMAISAAQDAGLLILPIHRLVRPRATDAGMEAALARVFSVEDAGDAADAGAIEALAAGLEASPRALTLGAAGLRPGRLLRLTLRDRAAVEARMPADRAPSWRQLAVNVLQYGVLEPLLGIDAAALESGDFVEFTEDAAEAVAAVREGRVPLAFLVPATRPDELIAVADANERMPQKSTYFYPKLGTGLVLNAHDVEA